VPFYETDAMGVVHHSNYVRYLEIARITWLDEHDQSYAKYIEMGRHFATTRVEVDYKRAVRFDDTIEVAVWLDWVRNASLRLCYALRCDDALVATATTEHASVDMDGRARRIPRDRRDAFVSIAAREAPRPGDE
jgi:acyl-CoA thioester hydrolase